MPATAHHLRRALAAVVATLGMAALLTSPPASAGDGSDPGPSNDDVADALVLEGPSGETQGDTTLATHEPGERDHASRRTHASVWHSWTAPTTGQVTFSTELSRFDTVIEVLVEDPEVGGLTPVLANYQSHGADELVQVDVGPGTQLFVVVDGAAGDRGRYRLSWHLAGTPPPNDARSGAALLDQAYGAVHTTTAAATREVAEVDHAGAGGGTSVWFRWRAPVTGPVTFGVEETQSTEVLAAYRLDGSTVAAAVDTTIGWRATEGAEYLVAVDASAGTAGPGVLEWAQRPDPPANDDMAAAEPIAGASGEVVGSTLGATDEDAGEPNHAGDLARRSTWYRWTAPSDGTWAFTTMGSTTLGAQRRDEQDTRLAVYRRTGAGALASVAENDDAGRLPGTSTVRFAAEGGAEYHVVVDGADVNRDPDALGGRTVLAWEPAEAAFPDVPLAHPFFVDVAWLHERGVTGGYADGGFHPADTITRQAMAAFLYRLAGLLPDDHLRHRDDGPASFADVPEAHPFFEEVEWLAASGIATGYADGTFKPGATVTRQAMAAFLRRFPTPAGWGGAEIALPGSPSFPDVPADHPFFAEIEWLAGFEISGGYADGGFHPAAPITRQAMAAFLHRLDDGLRP